MSRRAAVATRVVAVGAGAVGRRAFAAVRRDPELAARWEARTAQDVAEAFGDLRGAVMKVGQMLSYVDHRVPEPLRRALADLREDAPKLAPELSAQVVEAELGAPPEVVFADWDPEPFAAASIGQVHHARRLDGRRVAAKVQFPGIDVAVAADLGAVRLLLLPVRAMAPGLDIDALASELRDRMVEELDYRREAEHQRAFADRYRDHPHISIPEVHDDLSTERVLVTDYVDGASLEEARSWSPHERDLAGETIYRFVADALHRHGVLHGDLHPGNLRFHGAGRVAFLDFGLVRQFDDAHRELIARAIESWDLDRPDELVRALGSLGHFGAEEPVDAHLVSSFFGSFLPLLGRTGATTVDPAVGAGLVDTYTDPRFASLRATWTIPGPLLFLHRADLGLHGVLAQLEATADWGAISREAWPWDGRPANTPLGPAHRRWRRRSEFAPSDTHGTGEESNDA